MSASTVEVYTTTTIIEMDGEPVAEVHTDSVTVVEIGTQGPQGIPGAGYVYTQTVAATTWTINHNLGYRPAVSVITTGGSEVEAEVLHTSNNQTLVYLAFAMAGSARLT